MQVAIIGLLRKEIAPLEVQAKASGLLFCDSTHYYGAYLDGNLVAIGGVIFKRKSAVFKNVYVVPDCRHKGIAMQLLQHRVIAAKAAGCQWVTANCKPEAVPMYLRAGAKVVRVFKNGITAVIINL